MKFKISLEFDGNKFAGTFLGRCAGHYLHYLSQPKEERPVYKGLDYFIFHGLGKFSVLYLDLVLRFYGRFGKKEKD